MKTETNDEIRMNQIERLKDRGIDGKTLEFYEIPMSEIKKCYRQEHPKKGVTFNEYMDFHFMIPLTLMIEHQSGDLDRDDFDELPSHYYDKYVL